MPPEPLPWDRKDFFKERKHERSESLGSVARWRDSSSSSYHHGSREFARWGSADFRRPPGHGKQGGWHFFPEELGHGYVPSRSSEKMLEEESYWLTSRSGDGRHPRSSRENRGSSYSQKDWKSHSWETSNGLPGPSAGSHFDVNNDQRPGDDMLTCNSHPHSGFVNVWDQDHFKDQHDKMVVVNGLGANQRYERENSLGSINLKPLKWTRSGSLSSRASGYSHSSGSKSAGVDSSEAKAKLQLRTATPTESPSRDAVAPVTTATPFEETSSRKKPRLGWGEGLAKYEKKRVDPDGVPSGNGVASPRVADFSDCASPTTSSSVACSSSPGMGIITYVKGSKTDNDTSNLIGSPYSGLLNHLEGLSLNLKHLQINTIATMGSSLIELLQSDDQTAADSNFVRSTAMNKLLIWKDDISKALEITESEIDSLEIELKSMKAESGSGCSCPVVPSSLEDLTTPWDEKGVASSLLPRPTRLQLESSRDMNVEKTQFDSGAGVHVQVEAKDEDIDSPGTPTSKLVEPSTSQKGAASSDTVKHVECSGDLDPSISTDGIHDVNGKITDFFASANSKLIESTSSASVSTNVSLCTNRDDVSLCDLILTSNRESAHRAYEVFNKYRSDNHGAAANVSSWQNDLFIGGNFARRKRFLRFKEKVLSLKYRVFQHLWKEDIRLLSVRKNRSKSQKRFELSLRMSHSGFRKHCSSLHSRFYSPAGNLSLVPTTEMINFTSKLLSDSQVKLCRNTLKMPALILDKKEKSVTRFLSSNGLVEDPRAIEKERAMINHWTSEEKKIFMDNLAAFGKDFRKIASFLNHKTTADCVEFYYKNHKSDSFEKTKKLPEIRKQGKPITANTYLLTSGKKWNREMNAVSLDILGAASVIAAHADVGAGNRQTCSGRLFSGCYDGYKTPQDDGVLEKSNNFDVLGKERETAAADVLAGICGSVSSEAMSSCITSSVDPGEGYQDWNYKKVGSVRKQHLTPEVTQFVDDETCSDESYEEMDPSDWTDEEKSIFIQAISSYGKDFVKISRCVRTRSTDQCKIFFSKARKCLGLDMIHPSPVNVGTSISDDANGGGSDTEDACVVASDSVICSNKPGSKIDDDLQNSFLNTSHDESDLEGTISLQINLDRSEENTETGEVDNTFSEAVNNLVIDECQLEDSPELVFYGDNNNVKRVDGKSLMMHVQKGTVISTGTEVGSNQMAVLGTSGIVAVSSGETIDHFLSISDTVVQTKSVAEESVYGDQAEGGGREILLPANCNGEEENSNVDTIGQRSLPSSVLDTSMNQNVPLVAADTSPFVRLSLSTNSLHDTPMEFDSNRKPLSISQQNSLLTEASVPKDSAVQSDKTLTPDVSSSTLGFEEIRNNQCEKSICVDDDQHQHLSGHPILNHVESSQILRGYPLQIPTNKEMNGDIIGQTTSAVPTLKLSVAEECYLQKCNSSKSHSSVAELHLLSQNLEQKNHHHSRAHSQSSSDPEKPCKNGDLKLFGQILTHPLTLQKVNSLTQENDVKATHINLKFSSHQNIDGGLALSKFDRNNYLGLENFAMRTYGFWDGNRIQTGFSDLPESAISQAKCPAFSYPSSSSKIEHRPLQAVVKSNGGNLNGVSVFPTMESSGNGVTDYQVFTSRDGNKLQPLIHQRQDLLSEMQRLNGFDGVSSLQHQGRGIVGMNVLGRAGVLVGGACPAVSDPVAAFKMHYAKAEQYGGQAGSIIGDEESWRGKGDVGR